MSEEIRNENKFFAMVDRTRFIQRWSLMRNTHSENVAEHSYQTAIFAHALAIIRKERFPEKTQVDANLLAVKALFHDSSEVITGDLPTPVKYHDVELKKSYKRLEALAVNDLLQLLPDDLKKHYEALLVEDDFTELEPETVEYVNAKILKAADKLSAFVKCISEVSQGNREFNEALESTEKKLLEYSEDMEELKIFLDDFIPAFELSLDQLKSKELPSFNEGA